MLGLLLASISIGAAKNKAAAQASIPAQLSIQLDKPLHPVSPMLYGLMTEEINSSCRHMLRFSLMSIQAGCSGSPT